MATNQIWKCNISLANEQESRITTENDGGVEKTERRAPKKGEEKCEEKCEKKNC